MERMTKQVSGSWGVERRHPRTLWTEVDNGAFYRGDVVDRLAAYEDLFERHNLTPEQVEAWAKAQEEGRLVALPNWPVTINKTIGRYRVVGADSGSGTITLLDTTRAEAEAALAGKQEGKIDA